MLPGLPPRKGAFGSSPLSECAISTCLSGAELYVLYSCNDNSDLGAGSFLKKVDLNSLDGNLQDQPNIYSSEVTTAGPRILHKSNEALVICGAMPEIIGLDGVSRLYSEAEGLLNIDWKPSGWLHYREGRVYRGYGYHVPEMGVDVINADTRSIVQHLDLDIRYSGPWQGDFMCGQRSNGRFAVYSLNEQRYLFELSLESCRFRSPEKRVNASTCVDGRAYVLAGDTLLLIDIASGQLLREIRYLQLEALQAHMQAEKLRYEHACASLISVCDSGVVLTLSTVYGYALYLDLSLDDPYVWFWSEGRSVVARNCPGDLIYGQSNDLPMAWDKYSGEVVWRSTRPVATNTIQVGDQWLVYSQLAGFIECFHWKKTYISPHRPQA